MKKQLLMLKKIAVWLFVGTLVICAGFSGSSVQGSSDWQRVGGINLAYGTHPAGEPVPGSYTWPSGWGDDNGDGTVTYGKYTFDKNGGQRYGILYVDNSIDENDAYITQSFPITIPVGRQFQQFLAYAFPQGGAAGVWVEIDYGNGYLDRIEWGAGFTWQSSYLLGQNLGATSGTGYTVKIGVLKDPAVTTGTRCVFIDKALIWDWSAVTPEWQNWTFNELDYTERVAIIEYAVDPWQSVGGAQLTRESYPASNPPGDYTWTWSEDNGDGTTTYGAYTWDRYGGTDYGVLSIDNSFDSYDAYIQQSLTLPSGTWTGVVGQQFLNWANPTGGAIGVWIKLIYNGGAETDSYSHTASSSWDTTYWNVDPAVNATDITLRIGLLRQPGVTTGTRSLCLEDALLWDYMIWPHSQWQNWTFDQSEVAGTTQVSEEGPTSDTYEIVLTAGPPSVGDVFVTIDPDMQTEINSSGAGNPVQISFNTGNWNVPQTITVTAIDDNDFESWQTSVITHTVSASDPCYNGVLVRPVSVLVSDNDELPSRSCYDPCEPVEPYDVIDMDDLARLTAIWLQPYTNQLALRPLAFRAMIAMPNGMKRWHPTLTNTTEWLNQINTWKDEGFNNIVYMLGGEILGGNHAYIQIEDYPEARQLSTSQVQDNINTLSWAFAQAKQRSMDNYLYATHIHYTQAFADFHGLPTSGERSELTRAYTESIYAEYCRTYPNLDGFYGPMAEAVPRKCSEWFAQAVVPGLTCTGGRENVAPRPRYIVHQWMTPLEDFLADIAPVDVYPNTWLGLHAYNGEQVTDAEPWPFVVTWAKQTGLPTVVSLYPANIQNFPFNSPEFAYEIVTEMKRVPNLKGFAYWEFSGRLIAPLFRKALAYYASNDEEYSDEPWLDILEAEYGNRTAAEHFLQAFNLSARIMPDKDALFFCPHDNLKREISLPYSYWQLNQDRPWNWQTSRVRGKVLVPVWHYASMIAENPSRFEGKDGTEAANQYPVFRTDGGSAYDIIPPNHMASIRQAGQDAYDAALAGEAAATANQTKATHMRMYMQGYMLLSKYFETKVAATVEAFIAAKNGSATRKTNAQTLANQAYNEWVDFYNFCKTGSPSLNDVSQYYNEADILETGSRLIGEFTLDQILVEEQSDKDNIGTIFGW